MSEPQPPARLDNRMDDASQAPQPHLPQPLYETALVEAIKRLKAPVLVFIIAYAILVVGAMGLLAFGVRVPNEWLLLLFVLPLLGVAAYVGLEVLSVWAELKRTPPAQKPAQVPVELPPAPPGLPPQPPAPPPDATALERNYLGYVAETCNLLPLGIIDPKYVTPSGEGQLRLTQVYTPLDVTALVAEEDEPGRKPRRAEARLVEPPADEARRTRDTALAAVGDPRTRLVILLGDPGSGKSTFVSHLALCLALARLEPAGGWLGRLEGWPHGALFPVRLILRDFVARGLPPGAPRGTAQMVWDFLNSELEAAGQGDAFPPVRRRLQTDGGLVLLDGLDEVPDAAGQRERVQEAITDFARGLGACRFLITCRVYAYQDPRWQLPGFRPYTLAPFSPEQIDHFIEQWYAAVSGVERWPESKTRERVDTLKRAARRPHLQWMAERPLLLTLMATLHASGGTLPEDRGELYRDCVKLLLDNWQRSKVVPGGEAGQERVVEPGLLDALGLSADRLERALQRVAWQSHQQQGQDPARRSDRAADIPEADLLDALRPPEADTCPPTVPRLDPWVVIHYVQTRAGLLLARGPQTYAFPHRTFQEYLAACHLSDQADFPANVADLARQDPAWWREVFLLAAVRCRRGVFGQAVALLDALVDSDYDPDRSTADDDWRAAALAGQAAAEVGLPERAAGSKHYTAILGRLRAWLAALLDQGALPPRERADAGATLAALGDSRPGVCTLEPVLIPIPAGEFWMGSKRGNDDEKPVHRVHLDAYAIAKTPVTNAQYARFVADTGREPPRHRDGPQPPAALLNHPVVYVSWHDATAYCEWLAHKTGQPYRLPTEAQWEKAARGGLQIPKPKSQSPNEMGENPWPQREYPWGDEWDAARCNTVEGGLGSTSPVGMYPAGASPCGALDLAGNVWEWCADWYGADYYQQSPLRNPAGPEKGDLRVLRGGAWYFSRDYARCASRGGYDPVGHWNLYGFRVVVSPISPNSAL